VFDPYATLARRALNDEPPTPEQAQWLLDGEEVELLALLQAAYVPRHKHFGKRVQLHVLNNLQNGLCAEDCGYCSQSRDSEAKIRKYPLKSDEEIFAEAERAARAGATRYCMVLSGRGPSLERTQQLASLIRSVKRRYPIEVCLSVGLLDEEHTRILADAGLDRLNHNLNTSESHYPNICTTHSYEDRVRTLLAAKQYGIEPCSGFILGMGERSEDVVEVAFKLRELEVPSIPVNFLIPIEGNPLVADGSLTPERCLRTLALMRLVNPRAEIRAAAGREGHLRSLGTLALWPANSLFVEGYLTTRGDALAPTLHMIRDAGFEVEGNPPGTREASLPAGGFRLEGSDGEILKPEIAQSAPAPAARRGRSGAGRAAPQASPGEAPPGLPGPSAHKP
jgi:biotin synthase